jgi:hypothetical protein
MAYPVFTRFGSWPGAFAGIAPVCRYLSLARHGLGRRFVIGRFSAGHIVLCQDPRGAHLGYLRKTFSIASDAMRLFSSCDLTTHPHFVRGERPSGTGQGLD